MEIVHILVAKIFPTLWLRLKVSKTLYLGSVNIQICSSVPFGLLLPFVLFFCILSKLFNLHPGKLMLPRDIITSFLSWHECYLIYTPSYLADIKIKRKKRMETFMSSWISACRAAIWSVPLQRGREKTEVYCFIRSSFP